GFRRDRLGLARWLTLPNHPLTARVAVNRFWALFWGRGLVETQENFGTQGKPPLDTALLDWLARDFINSGWNVKALLKKIVLSSTYRQASDYGLEDRGRHSASEDLAGQSAIRNSQSPIASLARGPSHRLGAEAIR